MYPTYEQHPMILVVGGNRQHRRLLRPGCARFLPCLVLTVADAATALTVARTVRFDLVVKPSSGAMWDSVIQEILADPALARAGVKPAGAISA